MVTSSRFAVEAGPRQRPEQVGHALAFRQVAQEQHALHAAGSALRRGSVASGTPLMTISTRSAGTRSSSRDEAPGSRADHHDAVRQREHPARQPLQGAGSLL